MTETVAEPHADDLPEGWAEVHISDVADVNPRKKKEDRLDDGTPVSFVPMAAVDADAGAITEPEERTYGAVKKGYKHFRDDDVIFARITPSMENGKAAVARGLVNGVGFGSTEFHVIRPSAAVLPEYVYHFVRQETYRHEAAVYMTGAVGQARVPPDYVRETELTLAPLAEQARIVEAAEALLARVRDVRGRLDRVPEILRRFRQSVLVTAYDGQLTEDWRAAHPDIESANALLGRVEEERRARLGKKYKAPAEPEADDLGDLPEGWAWTWISGVAECLDKVRVPVSAADRASRQGEIPYYGANGQVGWIDDFLFDEDLVLVVEDETFVGRKKPFSYIVRGKSWVNNHAHVLRGLGGVTADYLNVCLSFYDFVPLTSGSTGRRKLNQSALMQAPLAIAPLPEQAEIVRRVDALLSLADQVEARVRAARKHAERTAQAVLAKAFRGELVPTEAELARAEGRDYETAGALLERVRAETGGRKAASTKKGATTRAAAAPDLFDGTGEAPSGGAVPAALHEAVEDEAWTTPRGLLSWFGAKRRGAVVVERVRAALDAIGAETRPDFAEAGFDDTIRIVTV